MNIYKGDDRMVFGVCSGLGQHFDVDPEIFRAIFIVGAFMGGLAILAYLILAVIMPD